MRHCELAGKIGKCRLFVYQVEHCISITQVQGFLVTLNVVDGGFQEIECLSVKFPQQKNKKQSNDHITVTSKLVIKPSFPVKVLFDAKFCNSLFGAVSESKLIHFFMLDSAFISSKEVETPISTCITPCTSTCVYS